MKRPLALFAAVLFVLSSPACTSAPPARPAASPDKDPELARAKTRKPAADDDDDDDDDDKGKQAKGGSTSAPTPPPPPGPPPLPTVDMVEAPETPAPASMPRVSFRAPGRNQVIPTAKAGNLVVKLDIRGWKLSPTGNRVHLILDNRPAQAVFDPKQPIKLGDLAPAAGLSEGQHVLVALPVRANGESVKPSGKKVPAAVVSFYVGKKGDVKWKEGSPLLVYNSPSDGPAQDGSVLLDFYVLNAEIAEGRFVVHAAVSGPGVSKGESISSWRPWRLTNARPGPHYLKLELFKYGAELGESSSSTTVRYTSSKVAGAFTEITRELKIAEGGPSK
jgi:hypothetical protein